jgi:hypothetical protein
MLSWRSSFVLGALVAVGGLFACSGSDRASPAFGAGGGDGGTSDTPLPSRIPGRACPENSLLSYQSFGQPFFLSWCTGCHSSALPADARRGAPATVNFDTLALIRGQIGVVYAKAADEHTAMPPAGGPPLDLRRQLGDWMACGAPGDEVTFDAVPSDAGGSPLPTGPCAAKRDPVPAASLPRCAASTFACMQACKGKGAAGDACSKQCFASDPTPPDPVTHLDCSGCLFTQLLACADRACHGPLAQYLCCASGDGGACSTESAELSVCVYYASPTCLYADGPDQGACFPPGVRDGGY